MKIMITGGAGFIGSHLCDEFLKQGHKLTVLTKSNSKLSNISHISKLIKINKIDVTKFNELGNMIEKEKPEVLIHLAGETSHLKSFENPLYDVDVNAKSTLFMLEKIRTMNLKCKFILGSTFIVIGKPQKLPVREETPCNPTTLYGANRLSSEYYCKIYNQLYDLDTVIFRITNSFGPREQVIPNKNAVNYLLYKAFRGEEITLYDKGQFYRDLIYVSDVVSGIKAIMKKGKPGNLYWISSGKKTWFYQLGQWLEEITGAPVKYIKTPKYTKKVDVGNFVVDNTKLKSLGWEIKMPVREGIKKTIDYFESIK